MHLPQFTRKRIESEWRERAGWTTGPASKRPKAVRGVRGAAKAGGVNAFSSMRCSFFEHFDKYRRESWIAECPAPASLRCIQSARP
eukprot:symbB.v1.2.014495.t1/scaffold1061.1/size140413/1